MWIERVRQASTSTFEEAAFCLVEASGESAGKIDGIQGMVRFEGPQSGFLLVQAEPGTAKEAAGNMLGLESEPSPGLQRDALGELANMICGHLVTGFGADSGLFHLRRTGGQSPELPPVADLVLELDCGRARIAFWIDGLTEPS